MKWCSALLEAASTNCRLPYSQHCNVHVGSWEPHGRSLAPKGHHLAVWPQLQGRATHHVRRPLYSLCLCLLWCCQPRECLNLVVQPRQLQSNWLCICWWRALLRSLWRHIRRAAPTQSEHHGSGQQPRVSWQHGLARSGVLLLPQAWWEGIMC